MFLEFLKSRIVYCSLVFFHPSLRDSFFWDTVWSAYTMHILAISWYSHDKKKVSSRSRLVHSRVSSRSRTVWQTSRSRELRSRSWSLSRPRRSWSHPCSIYLWPWFWRSTVEVKWFISIVLRSQTSGMLVSTPRSTLPDNYKSCYEKSNWRKFDIKFQSHRSRSRKLF